MPTLHHVSSERNRTSILAHGLDWTLMGDAPGIAGSQRPEVEGIFLCRGEWEVETFVRINNTGGPVDVWAVDAVDVTELVGNGNGYVYVPSRVPVGRVTLVRRSVPSTPRPGRDHGAQELPFHQRTPPG